MNTKQLGVIPGSVTLPNRRIEPFATGQRRDVAMLSTHQNEYGNDTVQLAPQLSTTDVEIHLPTCPIGQVRIYNSIGVHIGTLFTSDNTYRPVSE